MKSTTRLGEPNARIIDHLLRGGTVVTATRRQARLLVSLFNQHQARTGSRAWRTPDVLPFPAWAAARWGEISASTGSVPLLVAEQHVDWLWRAHVSPTTESLLDVRDLAGAARRTWLALRRHGGTVAEVARLAATRDQHAFVAWAGKAEGELESRGWVDPGSLELGLAAHAHRLEIGRPVVLAGFRRPVPALQSLVSILCARGWPVSFAPVAGEPGEILVAPSSDPAQEVAMLLAWLRLRLDADPTGRFAIVIGDLSARRVELERAFESVLQPDLELPGSSERDRLFDFAGGPALSTLGVVDAALACLDVAEPSLDLALVTRLLRNRYVGGYGELEGRTRLDVALRREGSGSWPLAGLAARARAGDCPGFARSLEEAASALRGAGRRAAADRWATAFGGALAAWGWPGERPLASDEYQAAQALRERLSDFAGLSRVATKLGRSEARAELRHLASSPFQPERGDPAVVVYDTLEAPGLSFDGLWVSGMTSADWPAAASPDPFLPIGLQEQLAMPAATATSSLAAALEITDAWVGSAREVVFSWPEQRDDARVEPSRIIPSAARTMPPGPRAKTRTLAAFGGGQLRPVVDTTHGIDRSEASMGGARILELQAKCPFRAFAEIRLGATPLEEGGAGIDPRARGLALHRALELVARSVRSRSQLEAAAGSELETIVEEAVARALDEELPSDLGDTTRSIEREWQLATVTGFLRKERERGHFEIVDTEQALEGKLGELSLRLRVDRVDRVGDGLVILDYKTGRPSTAQWRGARPDAPQLPLYAVMRGSQVRGIAFVALGPQRARYRGVASRADLLPDVEDAERFRLTEDRQQGLGWEDVTAHWRAWLAALARSFAEGDARVDPKLPQTCRTCHLGTLCRVNAAPEADGEGADGE
jgi:probable DNA repair protein